MTRRGSLYGIICFKFFKEIFACVILKGLYAESCEAKLRRGRIHTSIW